jgi:hypothetical protein
VEFGLAVIGALLVGLPLVAVLGARRLPPPRRRATRPDPLYELARHHRLQGSELLRVQDAVAKGRRVDDVRLRPAAVEYAHLVLRSQRSRWPAALQRRSWRYAALAAYLGLVAVVVVVAPGAIGGFVGPIALPFLRADQRRKARLALAANSDPADAANATPAMADDEHICHSR